MKLKKILTMAMAFVMFVQVIPPHLVTLYAEADENFSPPTTYASSQVDLTHMVRPSQAAQSLTLQVGEVDSDLSVALNFQLALNRDYLTDPGFNFSNNAATDGEEGEPAGEKPAGDPGNEETAPMVIDTDADTEGVESQPGENSPPTPPENNNEEASGNENAFPDESPENTNTNNNPANTLDIISYEVILSGPFSADLNADQQCSINFLGFEMGTYTLTFQENGTAILNAVLNNSVYTAMPDLLDTTIQLYLNEEVTQGSAIGAELSSNTVALSLLNKETEIFPSLFEGASIMATTFGFTMQTFGGGATAANSADITSFARPIESTMPAGFEGAPDAFSEIVLTVGSINTANELKFSINAIFNEDFLEWVMVTYGTAANILNNNPPALTANFEIQNPTTPLILDGGPPVLTFPAAPIDFTYRGTKIGQITFAPNGPNTTNIAVTFEGNVIYGAAEAEAFGEFSATLSNNNAQGLIAGLSNNSGNNYSVSWSNPPLVNFPDGQDYIIEKEALRKNLDSPYINYEIVVYGKDDLTNTRIIDIFAPDSSGYGLTPLGFDYQLYNEKELIGYSENPIILSTTDMSVSKADDYLLLNGPLPLSNFPFDTSNFNLATSFASGTHPGSTFIFNPGDHYSGSKEITKVVITMRTMIDQNTYAAIMADTFDPDNAFENIASIYYNGDSSVESLDSNKASAKVKMDFLSKEGKRKGLNGEEIEWTINGSTYLLMTNNDAYIVDMIPDRNIHDYNLADDIKVNGDIITNFLDLTGNPVYAYDFLGLGNTFDVDALFSALNVPSPVDGENVAVALHGNNDESLLIISLGAGYVNEPFTVKYTTTLANDGSYADKPMENKAKLLISPNVWFFGKGPGQHINLPVAGGELTKNTTVRNGQAAKEAGLYNPANQTMVWNIYINDKREATSNFVITEKFDINKQSVLKIGSQNFSTLESAAFGTSFILGSPGASMEKIDDSSTIPLPATGNYFSIKTVGNNVVIKFYYSEIAAADWFFIPITTRIVDTNVLTRQFNASAAVSAISNKIDYGTYVNSADEGADFASATKNITNDLIKKDVIFPIYSNKTSAYFYNDNTIRWKITVNPNNLSILNPVITDLLPKELKFEAITNAYYASAPTSDIKGSLTANSLSTSTASSIDAHKNIVEFKFSSTTTITEPLIIEYSTKIKDSFMGSMDISEAINLFENQCYLDGGIGFWDGTSYTNHSAAIDAGFNGGTAQATFNDNTNKTAKALAEAPTTVNPLTKTGVYHESATTIYDGAPLPNIELVRWQIVVNKTKLSPIAGMIISDIVNTSGAVAFNPESLKIYEVGLFENGTVDMDSSSTNDVTAALYSSMITTNDEGRIDINVPAHMDGKTFMAATAKTAIVAEI